MKKILNRKDIASALNLFHSKDFESRQLGASLIKELVPNLLSFSEYQSIHMVDIDSYFFDRYQENELTFKFFYAESYLNYIKKTLVEEYNLCFVWNRYKDSYVIY